MLKLVLIVVLLSVVFFCNIVAGVLISSLSMQQTLLTLVVLSVLNIVQLLFLRFARRRWINTTLPILGSNCAKFVLSIVSLFIVASPMNNANAAGAMLFCADYMAFQAIFIYYLQRKTTSLH